MSSGGNRRARRSRTRAWTSSSGWGGGGRGGRGREGVGWAFGARAGTREHDGFSACGSGGELFQLFEREPDARDYARRRRGGGFVVREPTLRKGGDRGARESSGA